jgi:nitrile hydratase beta subunit
VNGVHDLGGMHGFGAIVREPDEPVFHAEWERRVFAINAAISARIRNTDAFRYAIERMEPARYLSTSYYEHLLHAIETLLIERGLVTRAELGEACIVEESILQPHATRAAVKARRARARGRARCKRGDRVVTRNLNPTGHTRLPRYARGKPGVIWRDLGVFTFPDTNAHDAGANAQHCYTVRLKARDLWGESASAREYVHLDLWEDYLTAALTGAPARGASRKRRP